MASDDNGTILETTTGATPDAAARPVTRRTFIKSTSVAAGALAASQVHIPGAWAAGSDEIRIGLIGAGGRGTGAVQDAIKSSKGVRLVAVAELFPDRLAEGRKNMARLGAAAVVPDDRAFSGLDGYKSVLQSDANYIILATPPGFRPEHLKASIEAGKHVFCEKPVAVDGPGIKTCLSLVDVAAQKKLLVGCGLQRHHQQGYLETMARIHDGAIGDIVAARAYWNQGALWNRGRKPEWSDTEWQLRNWYYFAWLCGDHIVEQHVHNIDVVNWAMKAHPVRAVGTGGRQVRTGPEWGTSTIISPSTSSTRTASTCSACAGSSRARRGASRRRWSGRRAPARSTTTRSPAPTPSIRARSSARKSAPTCRSTPTSSPRSARASR
jgi:predicted dehydrogenase